MSHFSVRRSSRSPGIVADPCTRGWTLFDNLFFPSGTAFVVSDDPGSVPARETITSTAVENKNGPVTVAARLTTDRELCVVTPDQTEELRSSLD